MLSLITKVIVIILAIIGIFSLFSKPDDYWHGVYYPEGEEVYIYSPVFETEAECIGWGNAKSKDKGNFECNTNCKWKFPYELEVCD